MAQAVGRAGACFQRRKVNRNALLRAETRGERLSSPFVIAISARPRFNNHQRVRRNIEPGPHSPFGRCRSGSSDAAQPNHMTPSVAVLTEHIYTVFGETHRLLRLKTDGFFEPFDNHAQVPVDPWPPFYEVMMPVVYANTIIQAAGIVGFRGKPLRRMVVHGD